MSKWISSAFRGRKTYIASVFMVAGGVWVIWVLKDYSKGFEMVCEGLLGVGFRSFLSRHVNRIHEGIQALTALLSLAQQQAADIERRVSITTVSELPQEVKDRLEAEFKAESEKRQYQGPANRLGGVS